MKFKRNIQPQIENYLFKGKAISIFGARQVGKTTLVKQIGDTFGSYLYLNVDDDPNLDKSLQKRSAAELKRYFGNNKLIIIDEAQNISDIGLMTKRIVDNYPDIQLILTGSSSFDLANKLQEPLTGRSIDFMLYPLALSELREHYSLIELENIYESFLRFGMYPEILIKSEIDAEQLITEITNKYLYKDILEYDGIKDGDFIRELLEALALQMGQEVSYRELASHLGVNKLTVQRYIRVLEKAFIIFRVRPLHRNQRNEISKRRKIFFYDLGVRNALIRNTNRLSLRNDVGQLWENFGIVERMKLHQNRKENPLYKFWRTHQGKEIDLVEEYGGSMKVYEFKYKKAQVTIPGEFQDAYSVSEFNVVHKDNFIEHLI